MVATSHHVSANNRLLHQFPTPAVRRVKYKYSQQQSLKFNDKMSHMTFELDVPDDSARDISERHDDGQVFFIKKK
jgi:hypothetical protein